MIQNAHASLSVISILALSALGLVVGYAIKVLSNWLPSSLAQEWESQAKEILDNDSGLSKLIDAKSETGLSRVIVLIATSAITTITFLRFGIALESAIVLLFAWGLIILALIDARHHLLPDVIVLPLLWIGLIANSFEMFCNLTDALWGAVCGYGSLWLILVGFKVVTQKDGMGLGDVKMLAMIGAWTGWQFLPLTILIASVIGVFVVLGLKLINKLKEDAPIPFGPFLAIGGWITLLWGKELLN